MENFLSQNQAAEFLGVAVTTLMRYRKKGFIEPIVLRQLVLYSKNELEDFRQTFSASGRPRRKTAR